MRIRMMPFFVLAVLFAVPVFGQDDAVNRPVPSYDGRIFGETDDIRVDAEGVSALLAAPPGSGLEVDRLRDIKLVVAALPNGLREIGLTEDQIRTRLESRLRSINLRPLPEDEARPEWLSVEINGVGSAYRIDLLFKRRAFNYLTVPTDVFVPTDVEVAMFTSEAVTWSIGSVGNHGGDMNFVLNSVDRHLEQFLEAYLAANPL